MAAQDLTKNIPHIAALAILVLVLLFVLVNFGWVRCCDIPGFCGVYYSVKGTPRVAIVAGDAGMGSPDDLRNLLATRTGTFAEILPLENILSSGVLDKYQLVLVEKAKAIPTFQLHAFRDYVQKGGRLVWIGDAGTQLGGEDYLCESVTIRYKRAAVQQVGNQTAEVCGNWEEYTPIYPEGYPGLCSQNFGEIVKKFIEENATTYNLVTSGSSKLCSQEKNPYVVTGAERITACIADAVGAVPNIDLQRTPAAYFTELCASRPYDTWKRGPSKTPTGTIVQGIDFGGTTLGIDFVKTYSSNTSLWLRLVPSQFGHPLIRGYETETEVPQYFGTGPVALVDASRFAVSSPLARSAVVSNLKVFETVEGRSIWPAIVVSNPAGAVLAKGGLVAYYAFPPEYVRAPGLINNLVDFALCK